MKKIGIVIVNYNGIKYNEDCINSIFNSSYKNIEIVIVDNNSKDNSIEKLKNIYSDRIIIIENNKNLGFAGATNIGIKYCMKSGCDYLLLLNNDTVINKHMISNMLYTSERYNGCVVSPKIYYFEPNNMIWSAGGEIKWSRGYTLQYGMKEIDKGQYDIEKRISFATGCCMLIPKNIIKAIGLISEEYFLYFEDTDYCVKIQQAGYEIYYEPKAFMYHKVSASTGGENSPSYIYYFYRNRLYFNNKYNDNKKYYIYITFSWIKKIIIWLLKAKIDLVKSLKCAIIDYKENINGKV
ncbi:glycosyltransferase family 2 protein [Clostridium butyricum]|uniref:glycosyltransferase family 2 protein n=1 Tax=Clostridium butyricum TaxID=1492 RepID=UPI0002CBD038|nr:glycosyltransferase family 2 protein [Clostridium butyricum]EMU55906.1 family 2 glycosyl transferase [Clostridium butyricum DKU-01]